MTQLQHHHQQEAHVAVMAFPFGTHAAPLLDLALRLAAAAPHVQFSFFSTAKSNASVFGAPKGNQIPRNLRAFDVDDGLPEGYIFTGKWGEDVELFFKATPSNFNKSLDKAVSETKKNITSFITDAFLCFAADLARDLNIPLISLWTAAASGLSAHLNTDLIRHTIQERSTAGDQDSLSLSSSVPGIYPEIRVKDLPLEVYGGNLESVFSRRLHQMSHTLPSATAIVLNSFEDLDPTIINHLKSKFNHCLTLGPFNLLTSPTPSSHAADDPHGCLTWLSTRKPSSVAYVSFGTVTTPPPAELAALAEALEQTGVAFLWSIKEAQKVHLPTGFLDRTNESGRGMLVPWAPQKQVLSHTSTGAFVTHCGWNSVLESISGGVPLICRPFFGDQNLNARLVSAVWGIGLVASNGVLSRNGLQEDLDSILHSEQGHIMREKVAVLKHLAQQAVSPTGTSTHNFNTLLKLVTQLTSPSS